MTVGAAVVWEEQSRTPMWSRKELHQPVSAERITETASGIYRPCSVRMPLIPCLDRCTGFPKFNLALSWFVFNKTIRMVLSMPRLVTFLPQLDSPAKSFGWPLLSLTLLPLLLWRISNFPPVPHTSSSCYLRAFALAGLASSCGSVSEALSCCPELRSPHPAVPSSALAH